MKVNDIKDKTVVAMSGGVDSSVAAKLLANNDDSVIGVSMQVWDYRKNGGCQTKATCCSPDDFTDARKVAYKIGIPYYVFDFEDNFREEVIDNFVNTYKRGETPNPCIDCNQKVKFKSLRERAETFECKNVATGHYAIIEKDGLGYHLLRSLDKEKDQSYFLYGLSQAELSNTIFPVGKMTKAEVREIAKEAGLSTASKPESQDICFVKGSVQDFLVKIGGKAPSGNIVNKNGKVLAKHTGIQEYTVGQRKGLNIGGHSEPLYVSEICADTNTVIVGPKEELELESFKVKSTSWVAPSALELIKNSSGGTLEIDAIAQMRHRHDGVRVKVKLTESDSEVKVDFVDTWSTVSPGQACVFYDLANKEVLGGGRVF